MNYKALGERVRLQRRSQHLTQAQAAERAQISISFLGHIERGTRKASLETLISLCEVLKVSPTILLQDSLSADALGESVADRRDIVQEISMSVIERLRQWNEEQK